MRESIKFGMIRTQEEFDSLKKFAESFNHKVGHDSILPIYTIDRGDQMIGYFNLICYPIVCPSIHPKVGTPRDFYDAMQLVKNHFCLNSIDNKFPRGTCLMAIPTKSSAGIKRAFERGGFANTKQEIWQAIP